ncbi:MAG: nucleotidyltransferase [Candidatus Berkelbacteria bacterium Athens1014_28]|uniref:Nucleotidyltransferase n=1 Tax=Candidatus Berkelbacteria bacterium Athens1014_28 TaxID=2017145 RepID=A0A554LN93_9BACT|nr:MAG: nucleotidyltransferase [Candidatus Berkelbacteria bacterium Athens1014_28]
MSDKDLQIAKQIKKELKQKLGDKLISVILYGSRAKGTAKKDSDMDLLLVTKKKFNFASPENETIASLTVKYMDKGIYLSPITYEIKEYLKYKNLNFLREVEREGILL